MVIAYDLQFRQALAPWAIRGEYLVAMGASLVVLFLCMVALGGYRIVTRLSFQKQVETVARGAFLHALLVSTGLLGLNALGSSRRFVLAAAALVPFALFLSRISLHKIRVHLSKQGLGIRRALVIGSGNSASALFKRFSKAPELEYEIVGILADKNNPFSEAKSKGSSVLGYIQDLPRLAQIHDIDIVFTLEWNPQHVNHREWVRICKEARLPLRFLSEHTDLLLQRTGIQDLTGVPLVAFERSAPGHTQRLAKRALDLVGASLLLGTVGPLMAVIALAIRLDSPGPIIFRQKRLTLDGSSFDMLKFRTMITNAEECREALEATNEASGPLFKIRRDPRITRLGRILRKASLDELPQLFNVLRGEMSLVGPRPPLPREVASYEKWHIRRLEGLQGMTGLWQISGRSEIDFEKMVLLDLYYLENQSLLFDLEILIGTIPAILLGRGAY
jgi:exopolysaccharide biosynthesis polyprenyl glycosylphosphotransferase